MVCGNFIRLEPASYVFFCTFFNLRNLLYLIFYLPVYLIFTFREFKSTHKGKTAILHLRFGTEKNRRLGSKKTDIFGLFAGDIFFVSTSWYARLDSNQRPLESELSGCQAANRCGTMVWWVLHKFAAFYEKTSEALRHKASEIFRGSSQIVVWIKCGFSSPVQLNIFTLYPWIRSAASHPSTLARSSTIPACAFASSYRFCS